MMTEPDRGSMQGEKDLWIDAKASINQGGERRDPTRSKKQPT